MKILLVDDDLPRSAKIISYLESELRIYGSDIQHVTCTLAAKESLRTSYFDIMIMDVVLPNRDDETPDYKNGFSLLEQVNRRANIHKPERIIGITSFIDEISNYQQEFQKYFFTVVEANTSSNWKMPLKQSINYVTSSHFHRANIDHNTKVITIHGIRTFGDWQQRLREKIEKNVPNVSYENYKYGYATVLSFFIPPLRIKYVNAFKTALERITNSDPNVSLVIFCHSFGTYLAVNAIKKIIDSEQEINIDLLVLSGSVLESDFNWGGIIDNTSIKVINDCADSDYILSFSKAFVPMAGMAGKVGFHGLNNDRFANRFFKGGHSTYFTEPDFMDNYWVPLLSGTGLRLVDQRTESILKNDVIDGATQMIGYIKPIVYIGLLLLLSYYLYLLI